MKENSVMERAKFTYWQNDDMWLGYLEEYPDYMTQGETFEDYLSQVSVPTFEPDDDNVIPMLDIMLVLLISSSP